MRHTQRLAQNPGFSPRPEHGALLRVPASSSVKLDEGRVPHGQCVDSSEHTRWPRASNTRCLVPLPSCDRGCAFFPESVVLFKCARGYNSFVRHEAGDPGRSSV